MSRTIPCVFLDNTNPSQNQHLAFTRGNGPTSLRFGGCHVGFLQVSGVCQEVSGGFLDSVWEVLKGCLEGVWGLFEECLN